MLLLFLKCSMCIAKFSNILCELWIQLRSSSGKFQHFLGAYILMDLWFFPIFFLNFGGCVLYIVACYTPDFTVYIRQRKYCWSLWSLLGIRITSASADAALCSALHSREKQRQKLFSTKKKFCPCTPEKEGKGEGGGGGSHTHYI